MGATEIGVWLAALSDCRARTHKAIAGIRNDELEWVCPLSTNTIGTLLYHVAAIELDWLYSEILEQEFPGDQPSMVTPRWSTRGRVSCRTVLSVG